MVRTTVMASQELIDRLRVIARHEGLPLAEVIRQGLEARARMGRPRFSFAGVAESPPDLPPVDWNDVHIPVSAPVAPRPSEQEMEHLRTAET